MITSRLRLSRARVWLLTGLALIVLVTAPGGLESGDAAIRLETAQSLLEGRGGALAPGTPGGVVGRNGLTFAYFNFGQSFLFVPPLAIARVVVPQHYARIGKFVYSVAFLPLVFLALAIVLSHVVRCFGGGENGVVALLLGTPLLHYGRLGQEENLLALAYACLLLGTVLVETGHGSHGWWWAGLGGAAALATRLASVPTLAISALILLPSFLRALGKGPERSSALRALLLVFSSVGLTLWWNWYRFGSPFETGYQRVFQMMGANVFEPERSPQNSLALLFSPGRGLLLYAPVLLVLPLGWHLQSDPWSKRVRFAGVALFTANLVFFACYSVWWGGFGWGPRFLIAPLVFLLPLFATVPWRSPAVVLTLGLSVLVQLGSIVLPTSTEDHVAALAREGGVVCDSWRLRCSGVWLRPKLALSALSNAARGQPLPALEEGAPASSEVALASSDYRAPSWWPVRAAYRLGRQHWAPVALCFCVAGIVVGFFLVRLGLRHEEAFLPEAH